MTSATDPPRVLGARYELRRRLGSGGAGAVWEGHDRALDRPVAVKLLHADLAHDPATEARFRTEATAAAKLSHPSAVLIYDVGRDDGDDYLVMELVTGTSLAAVLADGRLPHGAGAAVGAALASALGAAHRADIVHRDVKPGNVLLTVDGQIKLADFGIARALGDLESRLTRTGTVLGTARYLAPEQLRDDPLDARADVYSLGVVLHEVLTGQPPFGEGGAIEVATRRLTTSLPPVTDLVPDIPPELAEIVDWATQVDPRARPADGDELAIALRPFVSPEAAAVITSRVTAAGRGRARRDDPNASSPPVIPPPATSPAAAPSAAAATGDDASRGREHTTALPATPAATAPAAGRTSEEDIAQTNTAAFPATTALADPSAGRTAAEDATPTPSGGRRGPPAWVVLLLVAGLVILGVLLVSLGSQGDDEEPQTSGPEATPDDEGDGEEDGEGALPLTDAGDHDPQGNDLAERPEDIPLATDGDPETFWPTQTYNSADLGGLKDGVGMWVQLEEVGDIDRVDLRLSSAGGQLELWVGDGAPQPEQLPADWGELVGQGDITDTRVRFPLDDREVRGDTVLLWFTELPAAGGGFRAEVREVEVFGG